MEGFIELKNYKASLEEGAIKEIRGFNRLYEISKLINFT